MKIPLGKFYNGYERTSSRSLQNDGNATLNEHVCKFERCKQYSCSYMAYWALANHVRSWHIHGLKLTTQAYTTNCKSKSNCSDLALSIFDEHHSPFQDHRIMLGFASRSRPSFLLSLCFRSRREWVTRTFASFLRFAISTTFRPRPRKYRNKHLNSI